MTTLGRNSLGQFEKGNIPWSKGKKGLYHHTPETIEKIRKASQFQKNNPWRFQKGQGKPLSEEHKRNISSALAGNKSYWYGKHFSQETKRKLSLIRKGRKFSEEHKRKISEARIKYFQDHPEAREHMRKSRLHRVLPIKDTIPEIMIQDGLKRLNILFETHKSLNISESDIFIEPNICIYADGCWWHGCEKCFDMNKMINSQQGKAILIRKIKDNLITLKLQKEGYIVLRFWEHDIKNNFEDKVLDNIIFTINKNEIGENSYAE